LVNIVREIKEKTCFVSQDPAADKDKAANSTEHNMNYELPDGQVVVINSPRFMGPEALFFPDLIKVGDTVEGLHKMTFQSI